MNNNKEHITKDICNILDRYQSISDLLVIVDGNTSRGHRCSSIGHHGDPIELATLIAAKMTQDYEFERIITIAAHMYHTHRDVIVKNLNKMNVVTEIR